MTAPVRTTFGTSLSVSGEDGWVLSALAGWTGSAKPPPLLLCHGSSGTAAGMTQEPYSVALANQLAQFFTVYVGDFGGEAWGNDAAVSAMEAARLYLASSWGSTGLLTLVGISMGGCNVLNYTKTYPGNVRGAVGIIPAVDLADMAANRGYGGPINAAYSGETTLRNAHSPVGFASTMNQSVPILTLTSSTDAICVPSTQAAFVAARPTTRRKDIGTLGHSGESLGAATADAVRFARVLTL